MIFARSLVLAAFLAPLASAAQPPPAEQPRFTVALDDWRISYRDGPGKVGLGISITLQGKGTFAIPSSGEGQLTPGHAGFPRKPHIRSATHPYAGNRKPKDGKTIVSCLYEMEEGAEKASPSLPRNKRHSAFFHGFRPFAGP